MARTDPRARTTHRKAATATAGLCSSSCRRTPPRRLRRPARIRLAIRKMAPRPRHRLKAGQRRSWALREHLRSRLRRSRSPRLRRRPRRPRRWQRQPRCRSELQPRRRQHEPGHPASALSPRQLPELRATSQRHLPLHRSARSASTRTASTSVHPYSYLREAANPCRRTVFSTRLATALHLLETHHTPLRLSAVQ